MSERTKAMIIAGASAVLLLCVLSGLAGWKIGKGRRQVIETVRVETKTEIIRDTVTVIQPRYVTRTEVRKELVQLRDTLTVHDTTYMAVPVERVEYVDTNYYAVVTGFHPALEEIRVYPKTQIVTTTVTVGNKARPTRFGIGIQAGYGVHYGVTTSRFDHGPYLGAGISFNLVRF